MASTRPVSFTLGENELAFLSRMVDDGRFGNRTEVVRAGLRLLEDYETDQKAKRLRTLMDEGDKDIAAGKFTHYRSAEELTETIISRGEQRLNPSNSS